MFSRKTRKLSAVILMIVMALIFSFCINNNYKAIDANATDIQVNSIDIVYAPSETPYQVYTTNLDEVFPALPLEGDLCYDYVPVGRKVALTWSWYKDDGTYPQVGDTLPYKASYDEPAGYELSESLKQQELIAYVTVIDDKRPAINSLNNCTENVLQNQEYTLPKTLKGTVEGVDGFVDIAVKWNKVADTSQMGTEVYTATAVNSLNYIALSDKITAQLTLTVGNEQSPVEFKHYYQEGESFKSIEMAGYTFFGWVKADNASLDIINAGTTVTSSGDYFPILIKPKYLGISFRINKQGVRYGFALMVYGLNNEETTDKLDVEYTDKLIAKLLQKATFTATIYGRKYEYAYTNTNLKYAYKEEYKGYVSNLVFEKISDSQLKQNVKVDACFEICGKTLVVEGKDGVIKDKAQEAYDKTKFGVEDQVTLDKMVQMYGVKTSQS